MVSPIQELFHLVTGKNSLSPSFKAFSIGTAIVARFQRQGQISSQKGSGTLRDHQKLVGKYLSVPATKCSGEFSVIVFPVGLKMAQFWEEKALVRTE